MIRTALWCVATLVGAGILGLLFGGFYDLSATKQHPWWVYRALVFYRSNVVALDASDIEVPADFAAAADPDGAALYEAHCRACHGAPGEAPSAFALGMMPVPPPLVSTAKELKPNEIYWFIRNGLKMSGMPAWVLRMSEEDMWRVASFVEALPGLTPADYAGLVDAAGGGKRAIVPVGSPGDAADLPVTSAVPEAVGDPDRGRLAMQVYACRSCHLIPGMVGPTVHVGPSLADAGRRRFIAGVLANTPENMVRWITGPHAVDPLTAMPDLRVPPGVARDIAAYLYEVAPKPPHTPQPTLEPEEEQQTMDRTSRLEEP